MIKLTRHDVLDQRCKLIKGHAVLDVHLTFGKESLEACAVIEHSLCLLLGDSEIG